MERENLCEKVQELGPYFYEQARTLKELPIVGDVRGSHFMIGIELVANKDSKEGFAPDAEAAMRVFKRCMNRGVVIRPIGNLIVLSPPLTLSKKECDKIISSLYESLEEVSAEFRVLGLI